MARTATMRKVTFLLPEDMVREIRKAVEEGVFPSQNVVVREALRQELRRARNHKLRREFQEAARDPLFLKDLKETEAAFRMTDGETARMVRDD